jgi:hypothetical protein
VADNRRRIAGASSDVVEQKAAIHRIPLQYRRFNDGRSWIRTRDLFLIRSERGRACVGRVRVWPAPVGLCALDTDRCGRDPGG